MASDTNRVPMLIHGVTYDLASPALPPPLPPYRGPAIMKPSPTVNEPGGLATSGQVRGLRLGSVVPASETTLQPTLAQSGSASIEKGAPIGTPDYGFPSLRDHYQIPPAVSTRGCSATGSAPIFQAIQAPHTSAVTQQRTGTTNLPPASYASEMARGASV